MDKNTNQNAIFANNELSLRHIQVYGFDFDFTLIEYSEEVLKFIYERTRDRLVNALNVCSPVITATCTHITCILSCCLFDPLVSQWCVAVTVSTGICHSWVTLRYSKCIHLPPFLLIPLSSFPSSLDCFCFSSFLSFTSLSDLSLSLSYHPNTHKPQRYTCTVKGQHHALVCTGVQ